MIKIHNIYEYRKPKSYENWIIYTTRDNVYIESCSDEDNAIRIVGMLNDVDEKNGHGRTIKYINKNEMEII